MCGAKVIRAGSFRTRPESACFRVEGMSNLGRFGCQDLQDSGRRNEAVGGLHRNRFGRKRYMSVADLIWTEGLILPVPKRLLHFFIKVSTREPPRHISMLRFRLYCYCNRVVFSERKTHDSHVFENLRTIWRPARLTSNRECS